MTTHRVPAWVTYPGEDWVQVTPREAGLDTELWQRFLAEHPVTGAQWEGEVHGAGEWGAVLTRGGCLVHTWSNPDYRFQSASLGKAFTRAVFGLAVDAGMIQPDDQISDTWTRAVLSAAKASTIRPLAGSPPIRYPFQCLTNCL
jgi:hypothetical protein